MKYVLTMFFAVACVGCAHTISDFGPNKLTITPSTEWEIQKGSNTKVKPKIQTSMDWNF